MKNFRRTLATKRKPDPAYVDPAAFIMRLTERMEEDGIYVSAGSACAARKPQPSVTLKAMGIQNPMLGSTIRLSFSVYTTMEEIDYTLRAMYDKIPILRKYTRRR